jgi:hypothetical protein
VTVVFPRSGQLIEQVDRFLFVLLAFGRRRRREFREADPQEGKDRASLFD